VPKEISTGRLPWFLATMMIFMVNSGWRAGAPQPFVCLRETAGG